MSTDPVVAVLTVTMHDDWQTHSTEYDSTCDAASALAELAEELGCYVEPGPVPGGRKGCLMRDVHTEAPIRVSEIIADYRITEE